MARRQICFILVQLVPVTLQIALQVSVATRAASRSKSRSVTCFSEYVAAFERGYDPLSGEYKQRERVFQERLDRIHELNSRPGRLWTASVSELTDWTETELRRLRGWRRSGADATAGNGESALLEENVHLFKHPPASIDWQHLDALKKVPNQGSCGSCWAVTTASVLSSRHEIHMTGNRTFSAQQLVDCVPNPNKCGGDGGCEGATVEVALDYVLANGLSSTSEVPYMGRDQKCVVPPVLVAEKPSASLHRAIASMSFGLGGYSKLPENQALPLMQALSDGPVGISVAAMGWNLYGAGVFNDCGWEIDHAVVLVGYGEQQRSGATIKYWTLQNSWGSSWGEDGHIRLFRHNTASEDDAYCGVDNDPKAGTACRPYPDSVETCGMCGLLYDSVAPHFFSRESSNVTKASVRAQQQAH